VEKFTAEKCEVNKTLNDTITKVFDDAPCGVCEAGEVLKYDTTNKTYTCQTCEDGTFTEK
jgi:hypothetical protein